MKNIAFFIGFLLTFNNLSAQKIVTKNYNIKEISEVNFKLQFAKNIEVKNWDKNSIRVIAQANLNDNTANDKFTLKQNTIGKTLKIKSDYKDFFKHHKNKNVIVCGNCNEYNNNNNCTKIEVNYTIYIPKAIDISVKSISGNVKIDTLKNNLKLDLVSGNIHIKKHSNFMNLKTVSGDIDLVINNAEFKAQTVTGNLYSNLDIEFIKNEKRSYHSKIEGVVANGNAKLKLQTVSGDVLLRKQ